MHGNFISLTGIKCSVMRHLPLKVKRLSILTRLNITNVVMIEVPEKERHIFSFAMFPVVQYKSVT